MYVTFDNVPFFSSVLMGVEPFDLFEPFVLFDLLEPLELSLLPGPVPLDLLLLLLPLSVLPLT